MDLASVVHRAATDPVLPGDVTARARDLGPLESPFIWLGLASAAVAVLAAVVALAHRRRVRRWGFTAFGVLLLLAAVTALNSYVGYVRTSDDLARLLQRGPGVVNLAGRLLDDDKEAPSSAPHPGTGTRGRRAADRRREPARPRPRDPVRQQLRRPAARVHHRHRAPLPRRLPDPRLPLRRPSRLAHLRRRARHAARAAEGRRHRADDRGQRRPDRRQPGHGLGMPRRPRRPAAGDLPRAHRRPGDRPALPHPRRPHPPRPGRHVRRRLRRAQHRPPPRRRVRHPADRAAVRRPQRLRRRPRTATRPPSRPTPRAATCPR